MKKALLAVFISLVTLELGLQLWAFLYTGYGSFDFFLKDAEIKIKLAPHHSLFFVGDSTVYGLGCSGDPTYLSLPAQLEKLMQTVNPHKKCINLGYSATSTEEHLKIMRLLPENATVFYRGGISDDWNTGDEIGRFKIGSLILELRIIKMLNIMFSGLYQPDHQKRNALIHTELLNIVKNKNLRLYTIDYTSYPERPNSRFSDFFYLPESQRPGIHIPLKKLLTEAGYTKNGVLKAQFISMTGTHPNDFGYFLEAFFVFNFLCQQNLLGFQPEQAKMADSINGMLNNLKSDYTVAKNKLRDWTPNELSNTGQRKIIQDDVFKIWNLSRIFSHMEPDNPTWQSEHEMSEKVGVFIFHDSRILMMHLGAQPPLASQKHHENSGEKKDRVYDLVRQLLILSALSEQANNGKNIFTELPLKKEFASFPYPPYIAQLPPFPLELCPRFTEKVTVEQNIIGTKQAWQYFNQLPYTYFPEHVPALCLDKP